MNFNSISFLHTVMLMGEIQNKHNLWISWTLNYIYKCEEKTPSKHNKPDKQWLNILKTITFNISKNSRLFQSSDVVINNVTL